MKNIQSISEITVIESAYMLGAKSLGVAADAFEDRWNSNLRDNETFVRLMFLRWYSCSEPTWLTGLDDSKICDVEKLISEYGSLDSLNPETKFILGFLSDLFPYCLGDEERWKKASVVLLQQAMIEDPSSLIFKNWKYFIHETEEI